MNRETLQRRLALGEGRSLEFKADPDPRTIGREVCAFLNTGGGYLILGIRDNGEIVGVPTSRSIHGLKKAIASGLTPKALVSFEKRTLEGKSIWIIEVPAGQDVPYGYQDEFFIRETGRTLRADVATLRDMILRRQIEPERWERRFSDADLEKDLDQAEIRATARRAREIERTGQPFADVGSSIVALERLGLVKYGRLTNGGDVLFTKNSVTRHPQVRVRGVCLTSDKSDDTYRDLRTFEGPLVQALERAFTFIQTSTPTRVQFRTTDLAREDRSLYPPEAIREGLVNAFAHRDYADFSGGIAVHIYPDRLEIWNSGPFPDGVTLATLAKGHISVLRNPDIAHVFYMRGMMEKLGRGCAMIRKACENNGLRPPVWQSDAQGVTLTFLAPEVTPEVAPEVTPEVTPEVKAVLTALTSELSRRELQEKLDLKDAEHFRKSYLVPAIACGFVEMTLPDRPTSRLQRYRLTYRGRQILTNGGNEE